MLSYVLIVSLCTQFQMHEEYISVTSNAWLQTHIWDAAIYSYIHIHSALKDVG